MPDGLFVRPHPIVWRISMGIAVLYGCFVVFLLFQKPSDGRYLLNLLDPALGVKLPERSYAEDCRLYTPNDPRGSFANLMETLQDEFVLAHLLGWWAKTIIFRDMYITWLLSIVFELLELSLAHILPNFHECWWDHIIVDIFVCNLLGMLTGFLTIRLLRMKEYNWTGAPDEKTHGDEVRGQGQGPLVTAFLKATLQQFKPRTLIRYRWKFLSSWRRFFYMIWLVVIVAQVELNAFFLKTLLCIPPPHSVNIVRLVIWWLISLPAMREFHHFIADPNTKRLGTMAWLGFGLTFTETLLTIKWGSMEGLLDNVEHPPAVVYSWATFLVIGSVWAVWHYRWRLRAEDEEPGEEEGEAVLENLLTSSDSPPSSPSPARASTHAKDQ